MAQARICRAAAGAVIAAVAAAGSLSLTATAASAINCPPSAAGAVHPLVAAPAADCCPLAGYEWAAPRFREYQR